MKNIFQIRPKQLILVLTLIALSGCSTIESYKAPDQTAVRSLPQIPEIKRQAPAKRVYTAPKPKQRAVVRAPVKPRTVVRSNPKTIVQKPTAPVISEQQRLANRQRIIDQAKKNATVDIDPFSSIPESSASNKIIAKPSISNGSTTVTSSSSPAVKSLLVSARADIALGKSRSAISKLERGLRIEPQNAQVWHMLAKAHYSNSAFIHAISMAKKSNSNTNNSALINENWKLIKQAGERSGNASAIKEALDYIKLNP